MTKKEQGEMIHTRLRRDIVFTCNACGQKTLYCEKCVESFTPKLVAILCDGRFHYHVECGREKQKREEMR